MPHHAYKRYSTIPDNERKVILDAYASGSTMKESSALFGYPKSACEWLLKDEGLTARKTQSNARRYTVDETFFDVIDTQEKAYWLGFLLADGCIFQVKGQPPNGVILGLASVDREHLEKFKKALLSDHVIRHVAQKPSKNSAVQKIHHCDVVNVYSRKLAKRLTERGVVPAKSLVAVPYLDFPEEFHRHYWRGVVEGDGSIIFSGRAWKIGLSGSEAVVEGFRSFLLGEGVKTEAQVRPSRSIFCFATAGSRVTKQIGELLWGDATIYLDRKYENYLKMMETPIYRQDRSDLTPEVLQYLYEEHGNWTAVAKAVGAARCVITSLRQRHGMQMRSVSKKSVTELRVELTDEKLAELYQEHNCKWSSVASYLRIAPLTLRRVRRLKG